MKNEPTNNAIVKLYNFLDQTGKKFNGDALSDFAYSDTLTKEEKDVIVSMRIALDTAALNAGLKLKK